MEVEDHHRISIISKKTKVSKLCVIQFKFQTSNVNVVCAECGKRVFNSNHDACVSRYLNDVNARTKKPKVVPISASKPKSNANKSVADTPIRKTVASYTTIQEIQELLIRCCMRIQSGMEMIVQLILFIVNSGCIKHMTGNIQLLCNFVEKFLGTVRFGNDQFAPILGYRDLNQGNVTIKQEIYLFCERSQGNDLLTGHRRLSHLNIDYITLLSKKDVVTGLPKLKYVKDQLCSACEMSKAKRSSFESKAVPSSKGRLNLLHMYFCGPMRVSSINGKKYILVIVDDYSRYTWTLFLRSKDETPEVLKDYLTMIQRNLQAQLYCPTDRGTEFLNKHSMLNFKEEGIETSDSHTP
ncbi:retrovirus-related pol polyprotein from transposon TNT 1-94 [Tanacetum coccineum]|uniref:Retrovirus-related pol polyprotein from transposon TNT 1-94 n=1 Tax=Tanacetum coccineum TaxID=301880 RepID=A0ABQ5CH40_9ASTR